MGSLSRFLINIVAESLGEMMRQTIEKRLFTSFLVGKKKVEVNLLYYADDIVFFGDATLANVITIKSVLRCFELILGLKVNFHKSFFRSALGVERRTFESYANKLNCRLIKLPFTYLGIPIGVNPRKSET